MMYLTLICTNSVDCTARTVVQVVVGSKQGEQDAEPYFCPLCGCDAEMLDRWNPEVLTAKESVDRYYRHLQERGESC